MNDDIDERECLPDKHPAINPDELRKRGVTVTETDRGGAQYVRDFECPLAFYHLRGHIDLPQFRAGRIFSILYRRADLQARYVRMNYGEVTGGADIEANAISTKTFIEAQLAIRDPFARAVTHAVCCEDRKAGKRGQMQDLRAGLDDLSRYFREVKRKLGKERAPWEPQGEPK